MEPFNSNALALTIIGAFLGAIVGHAISPIVASKGIRRILRINAEPIGFDTALLMLLTANAIWVAAELIYTIFEYNSRDITKVITTIVMYGISAIVLLGAYYDVSKSKPDVSSNSQLRAIRYLLLGNFIWIMAYWLEAWLRLFKVDFSVQIVKIVVLPFGLFAFGIGFWKVRKIMPHAG